MTCADPNLSPPSRTAPRNPTATHETAAQQGLSWHDLVVAAATLVGAAIRLFGLDHNALWIDEYLSVRNALLPAPAILPLPDGYPPLFDLTLHGLIQFGGVSDWWVRLPSAVAGTLCIPLLYRIGRRVDGRLTGMLAACLLALHPLAVWYSQEARAYALVTFCTLGSTLCLLSILRGDEQRRIGAYPLWTCFGFGLHYYYVFPFAAQACVAAYDYVRVPGRRSLWLRTALFTIPAIAIWIPGLLMDLAFQTDNDRGAPFSWLALPYTMLGFVGGFSLGPSLRDIHPAVRLGASALSALTPHLAVILTALFSLGALTLIAFARRLDTQRALVLLMAAVPLLGAWAASTIGVGYRPRYALPALPFVLLWVASAVRTRLAQPAIALVALLCGFELVSLAQMNAPLYAREDNRSAARYVAARGDQSLVLLIGEGTIPFERYLDPDVHTLALSNDQINGDLEAWLAAELMGAAGDVFLVSSRPWTVDPENRVQTLIDRRLPLRDEQTFTGVTVRWYGRSSRGVDGASMHAPATATETHGRHMCSPRGATMRPAARIGAQSGPHCARS